MPTLITAGGNTEATAVGQFARDEEIKAIDPQYIRQNTSHLWSRGSISRCIGYAWEPPATTASAVYVTNNTAAGRDLDEFMPAARFRRRAYFSGTERVVFGMWVFGTDVSVRCTATAVDTDATISTWVVNCNAGTPELKSTELVTAWANAFEGASTANDYRCVAFSFEFLYNGGGAGPCELFQIAIGTGWATAYVPLAG